MPKRKWTSAEEDLLCFEAMYDIDVYAGIASLQVSNSCYKTAQLFLISAGYPAAEKSMLRLAALAMAYHYTGNGCAETLIIACGGQVSAVAPYIRHLIHRSGLKEMQTSVRSFLTESPAGEVDFIAWICILLKVDFWKSIKVLLLRLTFQPSTYDVLIVILICDKVLNDDHCGNDLLAICMDWPLRKVNELEREMLIRMDYNVFVNDTLFDDTIDQFGNIQVSATSPWKISSPRRKATLASAALVSTR